MSIFKRSRKYGTDPPGRLADRLGRCSPLLGASVPYSGPVLNLLAIAAGVLILIDR